MLDRSLIRFLDRRLSENDVLIFLTMLASKLDIIQPVIFQYVTHKHKICFLLLVQTTSVLFFKSN